MELMELIHRGKGHAVTQSAEEAIKPLMEQTTLPEPLEAGGELLMCRFVTLLLVFIGCGQSAVTSAPSRR